MATIEVRGELFNVEVDGPVRAPVLMLSNSIGTSMGMWDPQMPVLRERFRVVRYDGRGHHLASRAEGDFTIAQLGQDALGILDQFGVEQAHWCGVSMGGVIGQWLMLNAPARLARVVIANSASWLGPPSKWQSRLDTVNAQGTAAIAEGSVQRWFTPAFREAQPETVARIKAQLLACPARAYAGGSAALRDIDLRADIACASHRVLVVGGLQDEATPVEDSRAMADAIRGAGLLELDAAHLSNIEQAARFNEALLAFLTKD